MLARPGLAFLGLMVVLQFPLLFTPLGPYGVWLLVAAALWLCRRDPEVAPGVPYAAGLLAVTVALALVGGGLTIGTTSGPVATIDAEGFGPFAGLAALTAGGPAVVLLCYVRDDLARPMAKLAAGLLGLVLLVQAATMAWPPSVVDGSMASRSSLIVLGVILVHVLVVGALIVLALRAALARRGPPAAAET